MDETLAFYGGAVKALGNGKVGGHLALFTTSADPDLSRDFFKSETDFFLDDGIGKATILYDHGLDSTLKRRKLGRGTLKVDDVGVWVEAQLELRDKYEEAIYALAEAGKLGWSSGSAPHLVEREKVGKSFFIKSWPIVEASLTPMPVEPRTSAIPLKSLAADHVDLEEIIAGLNDKKAISLAGLPALGEIVSPGNLKDMGEHSELVESALEEFITHGSVLGEATRSYSSRLLRQTQNRFVKDGRQISAANRQRIQTMRTRLAKLRAEFDAVDTELEGLEKLSELAKAKQDGLDEAGRLELWKFHRITGVTPEELQNGRSKDMGELGLQGAG
jgi:hypothetical protein